MVMGLRLSNDNRMVNLFRGILGERARAPKGDLNHE